MSPTSSAAFKRSPQAKALMEQAEAAINAFRLDEAETCASQALALDGGDGYALHMLANVYFHRKDYAKAEKVIRQCLALDDQDGYFYFTYGIILQEQGKLDEALAMNAKALALKPPGLLKSIYSNIGSCYFHKRDLPTAIDYYGKSLALDPNQAAVCFNRGSSYYMLEGAETGRMRADFDRAIALDQNNALMFQKMAVTYHDIHDYLQAITLLRRAIELRPDLEDAWVLMAHAYQRIGNIDSALTLYQKAAEKFPGNATIKLEQAYMFPPIPMSGDDIVRWRERCVKELDRLIRQKFTVHNPEWSVLIFPFYQGYHGRNNLELMRKFAEFFLACAPVVRFTAPHCARPLKRKPGIRLGIMSEWFHNNLVIQFYGPLLSALMKDDMFQVALIANSGHQNEQVDDLCASAWKYVMLPTHLAPAQQAIAALELDMLVYLDIGMTPTNYLLGFARLAPIQMVMSGHPITTGIPNIDYFISSHEAEPENAAKHYSEKLLLLEKNTVVFRRKPMPATALSREELGLPADKRLYACPVNLFKIHPDMDKVFASILERDAEALIILFDSEHKLLWRSTLQKRFALSMPPELAARIHFLPFAHGAHFYHMMRNMDCVLDTFHFSFGTTAFLMLSADVPFVTLPGEFLRGRCGYLVYKEMGIGELIAKSPEDFVDIALRLAQDKAFRAQMVEKVKAESRRIFDDTSVVAPFVAALKEVYESHCT